MSHDHYYIYLFGTLRHEHCTLDTIMECLAQNPEHVFFLKHADQRDEISGIGLMYGVEVHTDTWNNRLARRALALTTPSGFSVAPVKRLPHLVVSNYRLPNLMGI